MGNYEVYRKFVGITLETERTTVAVVDDKRKIATIDKLTVNERSLINLPVAVIRYQYDNHLGSASLELDATAQIISYEEYHPFGTTSYRSGKSETEVSLKRYKYVGKERDEETGLYYYGFRYYAPWIARFINVDPLQYEYPHYTPFQYAGNKPITYVDLDGLEERVPIWNQLSIDMADAPNIYVSKNGLSVQSTYNAKGWPQNYAFFWDRVLELDSDFLDQSNLYRWQKLGKAPRVTDELLIHLEKKGFDVTGLKKGEILQHHHINQGRTAVALGSSNHSKINNQKTGITVATRTGRFAKRLGKSANFITSFFDVTAALLGDPHSNWTMFDISSGGTKKNQVYWDYNNNVYITAHEIVDNEYGRFVHGKVYASYAWDEEKEKYVGTGEIRDFYQIYNENYNGQEVSKDLYDFEKGGRII